MKIYRCKELLRLPARRNGQPDGEICVTAGMAFTAEDGQGETLGLRLSVSRGTLERYFEELA